MFLYEPVRAVRRHEPFTIQLGEADALPDCCRLARWREQLVSRSVFAAAVVATGCSSAYLLEQRCSPDGLRDDSRRGQWAKTRRHLWDRWRRGDVSVRRQLARNCRDARSRLEAVHDEHGLVQRVLSLGLWRYLDPTPLSTRELARLPNANVQRLGLRRFINPFSQRAATAAQFSQLCAAIENPTTRLDGIDGLWLGLRSSEDASHLPEYVLRYLVWCHVRPVLESDPVFGTIAQDLYAYSANCFGQLSLWPPSEETAREARQLIACSGLGTGKESIPNCLQWSISDVEMLRVKQARANLGAVMLSPEDEQALSRVLESIEQRRNRKLVRSHSRSDASASA